MRLGVDPHNRRATEDDLAASLYEISARLPNEALAELSRTPAWSAVALASQDQNWWFKRTEWLVGRELTQRIGDWKSAYKSLSENGLSFSDEHDYSNPLVIRVLLEMGADPGQGNLSSMIDAPVELYALLLNDPRVDVVEQGEGALVMAAIDGQLDILKLLLDDARVRTRSALNSAVNAGHVEVVRMLLSYDRVDPSEGKNVAIRTAVKWGYNDMIELLLANNRVRTSLANEGAGLILIAIERQHVETTMLLLTSLPNASIRGLVITAVRMGNYDIVKLLLQDGRKIGKSERNVSLKLARARGRKDIEQLLLQYQ
ncbi:Hypothetical protein POVR2_LOCUS293 [uncultured virus]|nr:Hypothetical protein POVR2_LOCUS293 [uncultured virus]